MSAFKTIPVKRVIKFILLFSVFQLNVYSQLKQDTSKKVQYLVIPVLFKTPEMGLAYGISGSLSFKTTHHNDPLTRTSVIQTIAFFTTRRQNIQAADGVIYFPKEKYILLGQISHSYFPDKFWGIGPNTTDKPFERYSFEQAYVSPHLKKKITKRLFLGVLYEFQNVFNVSYKLGGSFDSSAFFGKQPYKVSGAGMSISYDSRNITFWPEKGIYFLTQFTDFRKEFLSDYNLVKWITDLRYFKKIFKDQILAFQLYNYETFGNTPLRELASFGGPNNMRGFYQGRYRANNMISFITEYRLHLIGRFSTCAFGGVGNVYNHFSDLKSENIKISYGGGLRFALLEKEKLNIRLDYGYSNRFNQGLYITVAECF
ncbi:MAG: BamA/TamA family outer membrane protein [Bacteroidetes bacterium]|nr:BamA/TamA family outer membrane protein [Bacteroidota bacterium]